MLSAAEIDAVVVVASPAISAIACSTGPPGANCTTMKLITITPKSVGGRSSARRRI